MKSPLCSNCGSAKKKLVDALIEEQIDMARKNADAIPEDASDEKRESKESRGFIAAASGTNIPDRAFDAFSVSLSGTVSNASVSASGVSYNADEGTYWECPCCGQVDKE